MTTANPLNLTKVSLGLLQQLAHGVDVSKLLIEGKVGHAAVRKLFSLDLVVPNKEALKNINRSPDYQAGRVLYHINRGDVEISVAGRAYLGDTAARQQLAEKDRIELKRRRKNIVKLAREILGQNKNLRLLVDDTAAVRDGKENGAYVAAWVWVDFGGTIFDKSPTTT